MKLANTLFAAALIAAPAATFAQDWTGGYVGVQVGGSDIDVDGAPLSGDGTSIGVYAGYNFDAGGIVYGFEVDYDETDYQIADGAQEVDSTTRLKVRAGAPVGTGLAYGTVGLVSATSPGLGDDNGYLIGAGYDLPVASNITVGGEVLHHEFEDYNDTGLDVGVTTLKARVAFNF